MSNPVFQIRDFQFSYPLSDYRIGFSGELIIHRGDHILLQGASGSGKSTLLLALKGIIPHLVNGKIHGEITYNGRTISSLEEQDLLKIGYLQQNPDSQVICQTVFAELAFGLENLSLTANKIKQRIERIAIDFKITHLLSRNVSELSGGEKQKVNLLAILLMEPEVLLLDEPTAFLDPESAHELMLILKQYTQEITVIIVEHNLNYLARIVNRVITINDDGQLTEIELNKINWQPTLTHAQVHQPQNQEILQLKNLCFSYPDNQPLLNNVNLTLKKGEILAIHGKNGSGKSSLLKLIAKIIPLNNAIYWHGTDIAQINKQKYWQDVSLLWQNPEAHFIFNSVSAELNNRQDLLTDFNLSAQAKNNPFNLSEGQKRRLSLAIALNKATQLFLLDEPSFGQDEINKSLLINKIHQLAASGCTFIIITHDIAFSQAVAHRTLILKDNQLCRQ